jgi:hypothetical protein
MGHLFQSEMLKGKYSFQLLAIHILVITDVLSIYVICIEWR